MVDEIGYGYFDERLKAIAEEIEKMRDYGIGQDDDNGWYYLTRILKAIDEDKYG